MTIFDDKAPWIMKALMHDFDLDATSAAAIVGNIGHESGGFKFLQEIKPMVPGSRGGWGWAQWTGPRRRAFEAYVDRNAMDPASDEANYKWLFVELSTTESKAIPAVRKAVGLKNKVKAFEAAFERAGIKHYPERYKWAERAMAAWENAAGNIKVPDFLKREWGELSPPPDVPPTPPQTDPDPPAWVGRSRFWNAMRSFFAWFSR